jgi:hypothetical protein
VARVRWVRNEACKWAVRNVLNTVVKKLNERYYLSVGVNDRILKSHLGACVYVCVEWIELAEDRAQ